MHWGHEPVGEPPPRHLLGQRFKAGLAKLEALAQQDAAAAPE
jgi:hypothetical protein